MSEMDKLEAYLKEKGFEYERPEIPPIKINDVENQRDQIVVYKNGKRKWDAVCIPGSYGYKDGLLEIMGMIVRPSDGDKVAGWLTAQDIINRIEGRG